MSVHPHRLQDSFFDRPPLEVAQALLGKVLRHYHQGTWLSARVIETEAYYKREKGSHASLGYTEKRKALFMEAGTIYMYYARGNDSFNVSCHGEGNAVLFKSGHVYQDQHTPSNMLAVMQQLNPQKKFKNSTFPPSSLFRTNVVVQIVRTESGGLGPTTV